MYNNKDQQNKDFEKTIPEFKNLKLDETAKMNMRARLMDHVASNPPLIPTHYYSTLDTNFQKNYFKSILINYNKYAAVCVFVLAFGTAFAAQASLPGDKLYSLKTKVVEPVIKLTKLSRDAEVTYEAQLAIERQSELKQVLAQTQNKEKPQNAKVKEDIFINQESFNENISNIQAYKNEKPDSNLLEGIIDLNESVNVYQNILVKLDADCKCEAPILAATTTEATSTTPIKVMPKINGNRKNNPAFKFKKTVAPTGTTTTINIEATTTMPTTTKKIIDDILKDLPHLNQDTDNKKSNSQENNSSGNQTNSNNTTSKNSNPSPVQQVNQVVQQAVQNIPTSIPAVINKLGL